MKELRNIALGATLGLASCSANQGKVCHCETNSLPQQQIETQTPIMSGSDLQPITKDFMSLYRGCIESKLRIMTFEDKLRNEVNGGSQVNCDDVKALYWTSMSTARSCKEATQFEAADTPSQPAISVDLMKNEANDASRFAASAAERIRKHVGVCFPQTDVDFSALERSK